MDISYLMVYISIANHNTDTQRGDLAAWQCRHVTVQRQCY